MLVLLNWHIHGEADAPIYCRSPGVYWQIKKAGQWPAVCVEGLTVLALMLRLTFTLGKWMAAL